MEIATVITSIFSSLGVSATAAWWLSNRLVSHKLTKDLEDYKAEWKRTLETERIELAGSIKKEIEIELGNLSAQREYELEAKKRLYQLIGPLKFQLLIACRDVAHRIPGFSREAVYDTSTSGYYGISTIYRILRPLAIAELIEQQIAYADFAVDNSAIKTLLFKKSATLSLTGRTVICNHPNANWNQQVEHLFFGSVSEASHALIDVDENMRKRILSFHEFKDVFASSHNNLSLVTLSKIFDDFTISTKPLFWLRLVAFGHICSEYVGAEGAKLNFEYSQFNIEDMVKKTKDTIVLDDIPRYLDAIKNSLLTKL